MLRYLLLSLQVCILFVNPSFSQDSSTISQKSIADTAEIQDTLLSIDTIASVDTHSIYNYDSMPNEEYDSTLEESAFETEVDKDTSSNKETGIPESVNNTASRKPSLLKRGLKKFVSPIRFIGRHFFKIFLLLLFSLIIIVTILFYQKRVDDKRFLTSTRLSIMDKQVQIACKYIESRYHDSDLSVEMLCEELVTGPAFLEALFERELGMNIADFIIQVRINRAKDILKSEPLLSADEMIYRVGYIQEEEFRRHFKEIIGVSFDKYSAQIPKNTSEL